MTAKQYNHKTLWLEIPVPFGRVDVSATELLFISIQKLTQSSERGKGTTVDTLSGCGRTKTLRPTLM